MSRKVVRPSPPPMPYRYRIGYRPWPMPILELYILAVTEDRLIRQETMLEMRRQNIIRRLKDVQDRIARLKAQIVDAYPDCAQDDLTSLTLRYGSLGRHG